MALVLTACGNKHAPDAMVANNKCLDDLKKIEEQSILKDVKAFSKAYESSNRIIAYELNARREQERLCMLKSACFGEMAPYEFADCLAYHGERNE